MAFPTKAPVHNKAPAHDNCSVVRIPETIGVSFDKSNGINGESHPRPRPWANDDKLTEKE